MISKSSAKANYRSTTLTTCEMMSLRSLLVKFCLTVEVPMSIRCDNQATIFIANNSIFHERTKHIEIDYHFVRDMVIREIIATLYIPFSDQFTHLHKRT